MERMNIKKLPPIFKMSMLWNILPYYGHIHRWRRLIEKINTETKDIWDQNREQLIYIGRDFKRDIELDKLKNKYARHLRPNRSWLDLFSLSLENYLKINYFDFMNLIENLNENEVIIVNSHDDIFKDYQIQYWSKDKISDILPAINCPSFKYETKIFKTSEMNKIIEYIFDQDHTKSVVIEYAGDKLSINLVYGDTLKIRPWRFNSFQKDYIFYKLKERYELWEIGDCSCKPKKIRVQLNGFKELKHANKELERFSNIIDAKLGVYFNSVNYKRSFSKYDTIMFNDSSKQMSDKEANLIFTGDTLAAVYDGNY